MKVNGQEIEFPGINKLSFFKLIERLEALQQESNADRAKYIGDILGEVKAHPQLSEGIEDMTLVEQYRPQIDKLMPFIFPDVLQSNEIKGAFAPFVMTPFHTSSRFTTILENAGKDFNLTMEDFDADEFYIMGCTVILAFHYKFPIAMARTWHYEIPNVQTGKTHYYRAAFNADMLELLPAKDAPNITEADFHELMDNYDNIKLWKKKFPPNSWIMRGLGLVNLMDITAERSVTLLTSNLLKKDIETINRVRENLGVILDLPELKIGFTLYLDNMFEQTHKNSTYSIALNGGESQLCNEMFCERGFHTVMEEHQPMVLTDVGFYHDAANSMLGKNLMAQNIGSYLMIPLVYEGEFLGCMELAHPNKYALNKSSLNKLEEVLPIMSMASARFTEEANNRIEAIIQQECTTIHHSVKWRFEEEARRYMELEENGEQPNFKDIAFKEVFPLYGQLDVKDSSKTRNEAVKVDLMKQMSEVKRILKKGHKLQPLPALEELIYRVDTYLKEIEDGLMAGSEHKILGFLRAEIYPVFQHLEKTDKKLAKQIQQYSDMLDPRVNMIYEARKNFDESVTLVNRRLAAYLDQQQEEAQAMFPHYFERYKTDGVEYNMYIGESIVKQQEYHPLYLGNLRLWQLLTMVEMERTFDQMQPELSTPLEIASLILVFGTPLSIQFRMDEKRFDVEGAYNARYEIVKKRVDKAHIKGTNERITVPNKIAIIYTSEQDMQEYKKYIKYLQSKNYLKNQIEELVLEDLQGVTGLKALRVEVNYDGQPENVTYDEIIEAIGNKVEA